MGTALLIVGCHTFPSDKPPHPTLLIRAGSKGSCQAQCKVRFGGSPDLHYFATIQNRGIQMTNLSGLVKQLAKERDYVQRQLSALNAALTAFTGAYTNKTGTRRTLSAAGRRKISLAQKARWAKQSSNGKATPKPKRHVSVEARRKMAAAQRARWAKVKQQKKAA
jgi:hypothetical protein